MSPKITVITVVYNNETKIEKSLLSVISQKYSNFEYIVIDGASTDQTLNIINKYRSKITNIISEPDKNLYDAINKGIKLAKGEYIYLLHSGDTFVNDDVLRNYIRFIDNHDLYLSNMISINSNKTYLIKPKFKYLWKNMLLNHPTWLVKKSIFEKFGIYDVKFRIASDYDFALRIWKNITYKYIDFESVQFSLEGISYSNKKVLIEAFRVRKSNNFNALFNSSIFLFELFYLKIYHLKNVLKSVIHNNRS